ncbi:MAG: hypothetical protein AB1671_08810 [Thermodesulfobacteriota bacterium]|jgi:hypothetical protein
MLLNDVPTALRPAFLLSLQLERYTVPRQWGNAWHVMAVACSLFFLSVVLGSLLPR